MSVLRLLSSFKRSLWSEIWIVIYKTIFMFEMRGSLMNWVKSRFFHITVLIRHILSDKTGTLTENNLQVISIQSLTGEYPVQNVFYSQGRTGIDEATHHLLLNMTVNHSALSIQTTDSKESSSSFSEIRVTSVQEELHEFSNHESINHNTCAQVFCSSQDERV